MEGVPIFGLRGGSQGRFAVSIAVDVAAELEFSDEQLTFLLVYYEFVSFEKVEDAT